jgi:hypothetical protein
MRDLVILLAHVITTIFRIVRPGGVRAVLAESVLTKHELLILNRSGRRLSNRLSRDSQAASVAKDLLLRTRKQGVELVSS